MKCREALKAPFWPGLPLLIWALTVVCCLWAVKGHRALYADGSYMLYVMSASHNPGDILKVFENSRGVGYFLINFLPLALNLAGCESYRVLSWAYTFNSYFAPVFFWAWAVYLLRREQNKAFVFVIGFLFSFFPGNVLLYSTGNVQLALNAVAAAYLLRNDEFNRASLLGLNLALLLCFKNYEATALAAPFLAILIIQRLFRGNYGPGLKISLSLSLFIAVLLCFENLYAVLAGTYQGTAYQMRDYQYWLQSVNFYFFILAAVYAAMRAAGLGLHMNTRFYLVIEKSPGAMNESGLAKYEIHVSYLLLMAVGLVFGGLTWARETSSPWWTWQNPVSGYMTRNLTIVFFLILLAFLSLDRIFLKNRLMNAFSPSNSDWFLTLVLCLIFVAGDLVTSSHNRAHLELFYRAVNESSGLVQIENSVLREEHPWGYPYNCYGWGWTYPYMSAILADHDDSAIITYTSDYEIPEKFQAADPSIFDLERSRWPEMVRIMKGYYWRAPARP